MFNDSFGVKTGPTLRVTSWNQRNKDVEFSCGENDSGERSRAIMALLFSITTRDGNFKSAVNISSEFDCYLFLGTHGYFKNRV